MSDAAALALLTARYGFRVSTLDARRAGVPERVLFDAVTAGRARLERVRFVLTRPETGHGLDVSTYIIFA